MRALPYLLVAFMIAPFFIWVGINAALTGSETVFAGFDLYSVLSVGAIALVSCSLLAWWLDLQMQKTLPKKN